MTGGIDKEIIRQALQDRADNLFRQAWGEPEKPGARQWRAKASSARSMVMTGTKRGMWRDHKAGVGGDVVDFFAVEFCGLGGARDDFGRVIDEAARWCGLSVDHAPDLSALAARGAARDAQEAREAARDARKVAALLAALQARSEALPGSPAAAYLAARGITALPPSWSYLPPAPGLGVKGADRAALVAWATDDQGRAKGGQRILILPDGSKAPEAIRKPAFGKTSGYPARIPAAIDGGPLVVCEGPETAASIAQATGFEVWAVFGVGQFVSAPVPLGRQVVFCPDRDAPGSPAAAAFGAACIDQVARGVDLWIAEAPEPEGSKRDLNDTLQRAGAVAVAAAINSAVPVESPETPLERVTLPKAATLPDAKRTTLQAALRTSPTLPVAVAVAGALSRLVPVQMDIPGVIAFLIEHMPADAMTAAELEAIKERLDWMVKKRKAAALAHVSLPERMRHDVTAVTSLEALPPEALRGVICIRAPMGAGKTQNVGKPFVDYAKAQGGGVMAICHRVTLTAELSRRLGLPDYHDATAEGIAESGGVAVCLPSTTRTDIDAEMPKPRFVFIDEIAQVLQFLAAQGHCRTRSASADDVFARLVQIVRDAEAVIVADAGLDARTITFLEHCRPGERFQVIEMRAQPNGKRAEIITGAQPDDVKQSSVDRAHIELLAGGKVWIATEGAGLAETLEKYFAAQGFNAISITAANKAGDRQARFLANADTASRAYDVVIASPAISSGLSIEHRGNPHFTLGVYVGAGVATAPADAVQQIGRVRYLERFAIGIMRNNLQAGQTRDAIIQGQEAAARIENNPATASTFDGLNADIAAQQINARADFGAGVWWMLEGQGVTLERSTAGDTSGAVRAAEKDSREAKRAALIGADLVDSETAQLLKTIARTPADDLRLEAWRVRTFAGLVDLDGAAVDLWDDGRGAGVVERFEDLTGAAVERRNDSGRVLSDRRFRTARLALYRDLFEGFDVTRADWCNPDAIAMLVDRVWSRRDVYAACEIVGPKYRARFGAKPVPKPTGKKADWMVRDILQRAGLALVQKRVRLSATPPFLVNTQRGVADKTAYPRASVGGTDAVGFALLSALVLRRAGFDLDAEIEARRLAAMSEVIERVPVDPVPVSVLPVIEPVQAQSNVIEAVDVAWFAAERLQRQNAEGKARRAIRERERALGPIQDVGQVAIERVPMPAPRPRKRFAILPRLSDPENQITAVLGQPLRRYVVSEAGVICIWDRAVDDVAQAGADLARASVAAWRAMTVNDPDAWQ